jgi:hypothetical protein
LQEFQPFSAPWTFWMALSRVNGGKGGRVSVTSKLHFLISACRHYYIRGVRPVFRTVADICGKARPGGRMILRPLPQARYAPAGNFTIVLVRFGPD